MDNSLIVEKEPTRMPSALAPGDGMAPADGANGSSHSPRTRESGSLPACEAPSKVLSRLLRMADTYRAGGNLRQALEMYFELVEKHGESAEATLAGEILLGVAEAYEGNGELHLARSIYERML